MNKVDCIYYDEERNCCKQLTTCYGIHPCDHQCKGYSKPRPNGKYIKLGDPKITYDEITCSYKQIYNVHTRICDIVEENAIHNVIAYAKEKGVVDLILIDEQFVRNALKHEEQRQQKPKTNFDKITLSVESLAEFIDSLNLIDCSACVGRSLCDCHIRDCKFVFKLWLQQEVEQ